MRLIGHRGYHYKAAAAPNSIAALEECLIKGYGIETDLRDERGQLVISHDPVISRAIAAKVLFGFAKQYQQSTLALNIKSDGLADLLAEQLKDNAIKNYFTFDMSVPQMIEYAKKNIRFFTRKSEYEEMPIMYEQASGVWMDAFTDISWLQCSLVERYLLDGKEVCIVSPELHHRDEYDFWVNLRSWKINSDMLMLCTDKVDEAREFFGLPRSNRVNGDDQ